jgi:choline dehydrogenase-like flavoprotein
VRSFDEFVYKNCEKCVRGSKYRDDDADATLTRMVQASERLGFPGIGDMHSPLEPSFGCNKIQYTIGADGTRQSSFRAYLPPKLIQSRPTHLHVCIKAIGAKLSLSLQGDGRVRADGVLIRTVDGKESRTISAKREVVLAAGTLATPHLLLLRYVPLFIAFIRLHNIFQRYRS